jgi:hypothetical protein
MTIEEMKFLEDNMMISKKAYDALVRKNEQLQSIIDRTAFYLNSKENRGENALVYVKDVKPYLGIEVEAEPFE